ncbi:MAG: FKBP-type peptidyl-prolyl cis-trans isomerase [Candidatus Pacebacteria bacterium]|nr:FKBP-type peptidyl-prolyl cis-trans isomerase [Candidatus Paceibacterota bacterium]
MQKQKGNTKLVVSFIIVIIFIGLIVYTLSMPKPESNLELNNSEKESLKLNEDNIMNTNTNGRMLQDFTPVGEVSELEKIDLVVGDGDEVKEGDTVSVHYTGAVAGTGEIFQSSKDFGTDPITFPLSGVIRGWTEGIPGMKIGGTRRLVIPSEMAYGSNPPPGSGIPANAALVFDVELVDIAK